MYFTHSLSCGRDRWQVCMHCGNKVCACAGSARGTCPHCLRGMLSNYYNARPCGYAGCKHYAVAEVPRVKRACCEHAIARAKLPAVESTDETVGDGATPTAYTLSVLRTVHENPLSYGDVERFRRLFHLFERD